MPAAANSTLAYHSDQTVKSRFVDRAIRHRDADELRQDWGYARDGKYCCIGCLAEVDDDAHATLEREAGLPVALSYLADVIFEGLDEGASKDWPRRYAAAARPGADLSRVHHRFLHWLLTGEVPRNFDASRWPDVAVACSRTAGLHLRVADGKAVADEEWLSAARSAAESAAWSAAWSAARSAAWSAARSAARSAAWSAARSAAWSAAWSALAPTVEQLQASALDLVDRILALGEPS
jgi:hypothetical protein